MLRCLQRCTRGWLACRRGKPVVGLHHFMSTSHRRDLLRGTLPHLRRVAAQQEPVRWCSTSRRSPAAPTEDRTPAAHTRIAPLRKPVLLEEVEGALKRMLSTTLTPCDRPFHYISTKPSSVPMVMLLGNHSSGKSTFINHLLGCEVQSTGVAPTDDGFTVIQRGSHDMDDDGPTVVGNPQLPFQALTSFGDPFVRRLRWKTRRLPPSSRLPPGLLLIDTPGMIDSPVHAADRTTVLGQCRDYDFLKVTRWFAQRCDVILLMFDPANPGTTGETLDVLTRALRGADHKLLLVLNKVDIFTTVADFGRAYGALCWNLSKVIATKDMPRIYTTATPMKDAPHHGTPPRPAVPPEELARQREEVVERILTAPLQNLDNQLTEIEEGAKYLLLASQVCTKLRQQYRRLQVSTHAAAYLSTLALPAVIYIAVPMTPASLAAAALAGALGAACAYVVSRRYLIRAQQDIIQSCDAIVSHLYPGWTSAVDVRQRWESVVKPNILQAAAVQGRHGEFSVASLPYVKQDTISRMQNIVDAELPTLRSMVSSYKQSEYAKRLVGKDSVLR